MEAKDAYNGLNIDFNKENNEESTNKKQDKEKYFC